VDESTEVSQSTISVMENEELQTEVKEDDFELDAEKANKKTPNICESCQ